MNKRLFLILITGTLAILLIGGVAVIAILSSAKDTPLPRHFRTEYQVVGGDPINEPGADLDFGKPSDGGALPAPCYPSLPPQSAYTFWNPDPADPRTLVAPYVHAYNLDTFSTGQRVQLAIYRPDNSLYRQQAVTTPVEPLSADCFSHDNAVGISWAFLPDDPPGTWRVSMRGDDGRSIEYTTQLQPPSTPWFSRYCEDNQYHLMLAGFRNRERVELALIEAGAITTNLEQHRIAPTTIIGKWDIHVDEAGQLRLTFAENILPAANRYWLVMAAGGTVIGTDQTGQVSLNRYQACTADPFTDATAIVPEATSEATESSGIALVVSPTFTPPANCPDAPAPRFAVGDTVVVDFKSLGALRIMRHPDSPEEEEVTLAQAYDSDRLIILEGPVCGVNGDRWMWRVQIERNDYIGWAAEGVQDDNWMCPLSNPECGS